MLLLSPLKKNQGYRVRYYELDAREGRLLGEVPFAQANMLESTTGAWAFTVSGIDPASKSPLIFAGDAEAIHARIDHASEPAFSPGSLSSQTPKGVQTMDLRMLLGWDIGATILAPSSADPKAAYLEFLPNGNSLMIDPAGQVEPGRWVTDGTTFQVASAKGNAITWQRTALHPVPGISAAHRFEVRLRTFVVQNGQSRYGSPRRFHRAGSLRGFHPDSRRAADSTARSSRPMPLAGASGTRQRR